MTRKKVYAVILLPFIFVGLAVAFAGSMFGLIYSFIKVVGWVLDGTLWLVSQVSNDPSVQAVLMFCTIMGSMFAMVMVCGVLKDVLKKDAD